MRPRGLEVAIFHTRARRPGLSFHGLSERQWHLIPMAARTSNISCESAATLFTLELAGAKQMICALNVIQRGRSTPGRVFRNSVRDTEFVTGFDGEYTICKVHQPNFRQKERGLSRRKWILPSILFLSSLLPLARSSSQGHIHCLAHVKIGKRPIPELPDRRCKDCHHLPILPSPQSGCLEWVRMHPCIFQ